MNIDLSKHTRNFIDADDSNGNIKNNTSGGRCPMYFMEAIGLNIQCSSSINAEKQFSNKEIGFAFIGDGLTETESILSFNTNSTSNIIKTSIKK